MKVMVRLRPNAKIEKVEKGSNGEFRVWVIAPAKEGKANQALIKLMADYFDRPRSAITIIKGATSRHKWLEVL